MTAPAASTDAAVWFRGTWNIKRPVTEAYLRIVANRSFEVFVNGQRLRPPVPDPDCMDSGNWLINERGAWDDFRHPELVDPNGIGSLFIGNDFLSPRHADPTYDPVTAYQQQKATVNVTTDRPNQATRSEMPGTYNARRSPEETRRTPDKPDPFAEAVPPRSLERNRTQLGITDRTSLPCCDREPIRSRSGWANRQPLTRRIGPPRSRWTDWRRLSTARTSPFKRMRAGVAPKLGCSLLGPVGYRFRTSDLR